MSRPGGTHLPEFPEPGLLVGLGEALDVAEVVVLGFDAYSVIIWRPESCTSARAGSTVQRMALAVRMASAASIASRMTLVPFWCKIMAHQNDGTML